MSEQIQGLLVALHRNELTGDFHIEPINLAQEKDIDASFENNLESALAYINHVEEHEINSDREFMESEDYDSEVRELKAIAWRRDEGKPYYVIDSVWAGPISEGGAEYRFYPIA